MESSSSARRRRIRQIHTVLGWPVPAACRKCSFSISRTGSAARASKLAVVRMPTVPARKIVKHASDDKIDRAAGGSTDQNLAPNCETRILPRECPPVTVHDELYAHLLLHLRLFSIAHASCSAPATVPAPAVICRLFAQITSRNNHDC